MPEYIWGVLVVVVIALLVLIMLYARTLITLRGVRQEKASSEGMANEIILELWKDHIEEILGTAEDMGFTADTHLLIPNSDSLCSGPAGKKFIADLKAGDKTILRFDVEWNVQRQRSLSLWINFYHEGGPAPTRLVKVSPFTFFRQKLGTQEVIAHLKKFQPPQVA